MKSKIFHSSQYKKIQTDIKNRLNKFSREELGIARTVRESGDRISNAVTKEASDILKKISTKFTASEGSKAMEAFTFWDQDRLEYHVDIITHRIEAKFSMPNITSVDRLQKLYEADKAFFITSVIDYSTNSKKDNVSRVTMVPIEFLSWKCLRIGSLGTGQLQIKKASEIVVDTRKTRKDWMLEFADNLLDFYINQSKKIVGYMDKANKLKKEWREK